MFKRINKITIWYYRNFKWEFSIGHFFDLGIHNVWIDFGPAGIEIAWPERGYDVDKYNFN